MEELLQSYYKILDLYLKATFDRIDEINPTLLNKMKFDSRAIFIAYLMAQHFNCRCRNIEDVYNCLCENLSKNNLLVNTIHEADAALKSAFNSINIKQNNGDLGEIYQNLLNVETSGLSVINCKNYRNELGSYYTPKDIADYVIKNTIDQFIKQSKTDITQATIFDPSCGSGIFITRSINYILSLFADTEREKIRKKIIQNVYGCDVDPIVLEIAIFNILKEDNNFSQYDKIHKNFFHANFLILQSSSRENSLIDYKTGFIYSKSLTFHPYNNRKYDLILGNPPWEKIRFEEKSFYSQFSKQMKDLSFRFQIDQQKQCSNSQFKEYAQKYKAEIEDIKVKIKNDAYFSDSSRGELNTCTLFTDSASQLLNEDGILGFVVKSSILTSPINKTFFNHIRKNILYIYDFINLKKYFDIDSRERFSLLGISKSKNETFHLCMNVTELNEIKEKKIIIASNQLELLNPDTKMLPNIENNSDLKILLKIYNAFHTLKQNFPLLKFGRIVHFTNHSEFLDKEPNTDNLPVYEGKFFYLLDNNYSGFNDVPFDDRYKSKASSKKLTIEQKKNGITPESRFYIKSEKWIELSKNYEADYMLAWRSLTSASNTRTCIATILPFIPASQSVQFLVTKNDLELLYLAGIFNSIIFDYIIKCKLNGIDLTQTILNQIPVPSVEQAKKTIIRNGDSSKSIFFIIIEIVYLLMKDDKKIDSIFKRNNIKIQDSNKIDRRQMLLYLDLIVAKLYNIEYHELEIILQKFTKYYNNTELTFLKEKYMALH